MNFNQNRKWIIVAALLGLILGFVSPPPDIISKLIRGLIGAVVLAGGCYVILWIIKKLNPDSSE